MEQRPSPMLHEERLLDSAIEEAPVIDTHIADVISTTTVKDPVRGMTANPATARHHAEHEGATFSF